MGLQKATARQAAALSVDPSPGGKLHCSCEQERITSLPSITCGLRPQVDAAGFAKEMDAQKARAKAAARTVDLSAVERLGDLAARLGASEVVGWDRLEAPGTVIAILRDGEPVDSACGGVPDPEAAHSDYCTRSPTVWNDFVLLAAKVFVPASEGG